MTEVIQTKYICKDFAKTSGVLLDQTATTALAFLPEIHPGGVRGNLIRFKKSKNETWEKMPELDFRKLQIHEGVKIELGTKQLSKLIEEVNKRDLIAKEGISYGQKEYAVADKNSVLLVDNKNIRAVLEQILSKGYSDEFWNLVRESNPDLADKLSAGYLHYKRKAVVDELRNRLKQNQTFHETKGIDSWQEWIFKNNWLFGPNYQPPIEKQKISLGGSTPDYLFPTLDGFVDILEIKLPSFEVIEEDKSHLGSWIWSKESNRALGQVVNYLDAIDSQRLHIEKIIKEKYGQEVSLLKPRAFILIGESSSWSQPKKEALRKLNHSLHGIEVITYSDLVKRGEAFTELKII